MQVAQDRMFLLQTLLTRVPVVSKLEVVGCERGGQQLEHCERHATRVDALEDQANCFLRSFLLQLDHGDVVLLKALNSVALEVIEETHLLTVEIPVLAVGLTPVRTAEDSIYGE